MKAVQVNARAGTFGDVAGSTTFAELEPVDRQWLREVWTPYPAKATPARRVTLMLTVLPGTAAVAYELQEDESLFRQLVSLYALWGWTAIEDVQAQLARLSPPRPALAVLVEKTCDLLRARIVVELAAIEAEVGVLAHSRWKATAKQLQAWKQEYTAITKSQYVFAKADVWAAANRHLSAYHELRRKRLRSEDLRASKPGLGRDYVPGENDDRYPAIARTFGEQEKAYARTAAQELGQLYRVCPPAVMVADSTAKLFDPTSGVPAGPQTVHGVRLAHSHRESGLATTIVEMLEATGGQLDGLIRSLRLDGVAELASKRGGLERSRAEHWNQAGTGAERIVARRCLERWTLDAVVRRSLTTPVGLVDASAAFVMESEANTVLGMPDLVRAYAIDPKASRRSAFRTSRRTTCIRSKPSWRPCVGMRSASGPWSP